MLTAKEAYEIAIRNLRKGNVIREMAETKDYFLFGQAQSKTKQIMDDSAFVINKITAKTCWIWIHPSSEWWSDWKHAKFHDIKQFE